MQFFEIEKLYEEALRGYRSSITDFRNGNTARGAYSLAIGAKAFGFAEGVASRSFGFSPRELEKIQTLTLRAEMGFAEAVDALRVRRAR